MPDPSSPMWGSIRAGGSGGGYRKKSKKPLTEEARLEQMEKELKKTDIDRKVEIFSRILTVILVVVFFLLIRIQIIRVYEYRLVETNYPVAHTLLIPLGICVAAHIILRTLYRFYLTIKKKHTMENSGNKDQTGMGREK